jgi:hypothetical protein
MGPAASVRGPPEPLEPVCRPEANWAAVARHSWLYWPRLAEKWHHANPSREVALKQTCSSTLGIP